MPASLPRRNLSIDVAQRPRDGGLPQILGGSASAAYRFEACSTFTHIPACMFAKSPCVTLFTEGFDGFVTSSAAPIATWWSD